MYKYACLFFLCVTATLASAQIPDSVRANEQLPEVEVTGYLSRQPLLQTPASVALVNEAQLQNQATETLLPALNVIPGVRMEERSPGSYRLSLRGSLLRSPFGVRNVKVYLDEFPLTDAGGNTYLNLIDPGNIRHIEILKGPDGSLFGANSGGVVLLNVAPKQNEPALSLNLAGGSYGLFHENISFRNGTKNGAFSLNQGFQRSDGYRENSAMRRLYVEAAHDWNYTEKTRLKLFAFYADLHYQTPGGLTLQQFLTNPEQARPAAGPNRGAAEQKAQINNQTFFGGITHEIALGSRVKHVVSVFGANTDYKNPFITNYETRAENNIGIRTYTEVSSADSALINWKFNIGLEGQKADQRIRNFDNNQGEKGAVQSADKFGANQHFYFARFAARLTKKLTAEAALSANFYRFDFASLPESETAYEGKSTYAPEWMPRIGFSYLLHQNLAWRATISRGYSPPTIAEIRPSGTEINPDLQAETGWNYETGFRYSHPKNRFQADASVFNFRLEQAIVRRVNATDEEYFTNAGGTNQTGAEALVSGWILQPKTSGLVRGLQLTGSFTYNYFRFTDYQTGENNYNGNKLTGVPQQVSGAGFVLHFLNGFILSSQLINTGKIPLNDANTVYAGSYNLLQAKIRWEQPNQRKLNWEVFAGADNLLNQKYSLGNDINAFGNRYYNAAAPLNVYGGISLKVF